MGRCSAASYHSDIRSNWPASPPATGEHWWPLCCSGPPVLAHRPEAAKIRPRRRSREIGQRVVRWHAEAGDGLEHSVLATAPDGIAAHGVVIGDRDGLLFGLSYRIHCASSTAPRAGPSDP